MEFSQHDAGWSHIFKSQNYGEMLHADWQYLNNPARLSTYIMAGLPILQWNNIGHIVASQTITKDLDIGIFFNYFSELGEIMKDKKEWASLEKMSGITGFIFHLTNMFMT